MRFSIEAYNIRLSIDMDAKLISVETKKSKLSIKDGVVNAELRIRHLECGVVGEDTHNGKRMVDARIAERVKSKISETFVNN